MGIRFGLLCLALVALPAAAQTPEAAYQKLHAAALAKDVKEVMRYATNARRAEIVADPAAEGKIEALSGMLPKTINITGRSVTPDGNAAQLRATGLTEVMGQRVPMFGSVDLRKESGEWRVDQWSWSSDRPTAAQATPAPAEKPAAKPVAEAQPKPKPEQQAEATIGRSNKPAPCVIKPVMTDQELRNCGATVPRR